MPMIAPGIEASGHHLVDGRVQPLRGACIDIVGCFGALLLFVVAVAV